MRKGGNGGLLSLFVFDRLQPTDFRSRLQEELQEETVGSSDDE